MPTYEYRCKACGADLEVVQSFTDDPLTTCEACGGPLRKVFGSVGISFKGSGFYKTDSRNGTKTTAGSGSTPSGDGSSSSSSGDSTAGSSSDTSKSGTSKSDTSKSGGSGSGSSSSGDKAAASTGSS